MNIPFQFITVEIQKFGEILRVEVQKEFFDMFKIAYGLPISMSNVFMYNIYDIISVCKGNEETCENYEVIYIGQSNPKAEYRTIFDRLRKHEKVAEVFRQYNLEYRDKELMAFILHAKSKLHNVAGSLWLGETKWEEYDSVGDRIDDAAIIDVTEAMLIYHFKPLYNIKLKDAMPSIDKKIYKRLVEAKVNVINVGINLYLQTYKNYIVLITEKQKTISKLRILQCNIDDLFEGDETTDILYEDIDDELYPIIQ